MSGITAFIYSEDYERYCFSEDHPFHPIRWKLTWELVTDLGLLAAARVHEPAPVRESDLFRVHTRDYVEAVQEIGYQVARGEPIADRSALVRYGLAAGDNPAFANMHEAASLIAGGTVLAGQLVVEGEADHAVNIAGGLHHALPRRASGFCIYNDVAVMIARLRYLGLRVAYIDVDAHHGDGVQHVFYEDDGVLTFSVHEDGRYLFPGSGFAEERGAGQAEGTKWNIPLAPFAGDGSLLSALEEILPQVLRDFRPDIIVSQHGCDGHAADPLTHLKYTMRSFLRVPARIHALAHEYAGGRWVAVGGGGYAIWQVVPRAWAALCSVAAHQPVGPDTEVPKAFRDRWSAKSPVKLPATFGEE